SQPIKKIINTVYHSSDFYVNALIKTIKKRYQTKGYFYDTVASLFTLPVDKTEQTFAKLLKSFKKLNPPTERVEERVSTINTILTNLNFNTNNMRVIDIGAGNASIVSAVKQFYNLPTQNVYAIDMKLPDIKD